MSGVMGYPTIRRFEDIPGAIAYLKVIGGVAELRIPVLQALYDGRIGALDVHSVTPNRNVRLFLEKVRKPALAILADDTDEPAGPDGMPAVDRLMRWARLIVVHGTGGTILDYETAVATAQKIERLVLVECQSRFINAWLERARRVAPLTPGLVIKPPGGHQHPEPDTAAPIAAWGLNPANHPHRWAP